MKYKDNKLMELRDTLEEALMCLSKVQMDGKDAIKKAVAASLQKTNKAIADKLSGMEAKGKEEDMEEKEGEDNTEVEVEGEVTIEVEKSEEEDGDLMEKYFSKR